MARDREVDRQLSPQEEFLLVEFQEAASYLRNAFEERDRAINFYLTVLSAALAGSVALVRLEEKANMLNHPLLTAFLVLVILGFAVMIGLFTALVYVQIRINTWKYENTMIEIRRYFIEKATAADPSFQQYGERVQRLSRIRAYNPRGVNYHRFRVLMAANSFAALAAVALAGLALVQRHPRFDPLWLIRMVVLGGGSALALWHAQKLM